MTHVVINSHEVVSTGDEATLREDHHASLTLGQTEIVDLGAADVAALARVAAADCPRLTEVGRGFLGAGTHPAQPYLEVMLQMRGVTRKNIAAASVGWDSCDRIVITFLSNAATWKGETARAVKAALKAMVA